jgi:hypothetical protein
MIMDVDNDNDNELKLFVYVIGLGTVSFSVTIHNFETLHGLKKKILHEKSNDLASLDADRLTLYKVMIPDDNNEGNLETSASAAIHGLNRLGPSSRGISREFDASSPPEMISIVVVLPEGFEAGESSAKSSKPSDTTIVSRSLFPPSYCYLSSHTFLNI